MILPVQGATIDTRDGLQECIFDNMALYFLSAELTKNALLQTVFFGDFSHWAVLVSAVKRQLKGLNS